MLELHLENFSDFEGKKLCEQFRDFRKQGGLLPSCSICVHKDIDYPTVYEELVAEIGAVRMYREGRYCYIVYDVPHNKPVVVRAAPDFRKMDVFYKEFQGNYIQSRTAAALYFGYRYLAVLNGALMIHAAAVVYRNQGILFCGISGAGKSTQAHLWEQYLHATLINADKPCLICRENTIYVHGTPWSGKENVYVNTCAPVKCIVFVEKCIGNRVEKLSYADAFSLLYLNNYIYPLTDEQQDKYVEVIEHITCEVPVYRLYCDMSEHAVRVLYTELYGNGKIPPLTDGFIQDNAKG